MADGVYENGVLVSSSPTSQQFHDTVTEATARAALESRMNAADALLNKIENGTLPGGAQVQAVFPFAPANDTPMTTAAHYGLAARMTAGIVKRGFRLTRNRLENGAE